MKMKIMLKSVLAALVLLSLGVMLFLTAGCSSNTAQTTEVAVSDTETVTATSTTSYDNAAFISLDNPSGITATGVSYDGSTINISSPGYYVLTGSLNGTLRVKTMGDVYIQLDNASITNSTGPAIAVEGADQTFLTLKAGTSNTISDGGSSDENAAIFSNDSMVIEGEGTLTINGNVGHGLECDDDLVINGGNLIIAAVKDGLHSNEELVVNGGNIAITEAGEGLESGTEIIINGGTTEINASDDGINAGTGITIAGGNLYTYCSNGDGIDSNGFITITGGNTVALGSRSPEGGIDCDMQEITITGGVLIAGGGTNSPVSAATSTQCSVQLGDVSANSIISINGQENILNFTPVESCDTLLITSPLLTQNQTWSVLTGGTVTGGIDFHGLNIDGTLSGGSESQSFTTSSVVTVLGGSSGMGAGMGGQNMEGNEPGGQQPGAQRAF